MTGMKRKNRKANGAAAAAEESTDATLSTLDPFKCHYCFEIFGGEVFQCKNEHLMCRRCYDRQEGTCWICSDAISAKRCAALVGAMTAILNLGCRYAPYPCPVPECDFEGPLLYNHISQHGVGSRGDDAGTPVRFDQSATVTLYRSVKLRVLLHVHSRIFVLLNCGGDEPSHRSLRLLELSVGPTAANQPLKFTMEVPPAGEPGRDAPITLSATGRVPWRSCCWGADHLNKTEGPLIIPESYWSSSGSINVTVRLEPAVVDVDDRSPAA